MLSNWLWISRCGDYWQQAELRTDGACRIMMMMYCVFCCWLLIIITAKLATCPRRCQPLYFSFSFFVCRVSSLSYYKFVIRMGGQLDELLASLAACCRVCLLFLHHCILFKAQWQIWLIHWFIFFAIVHTKHGFLCRPISHFLTDCN